MVSYVEELKARCRNMERLRSSVGSAGELRPQQSELIRDHSDTEVDNREIPEIMSLMKSISLFHSFTEQQFSRLCVAVRKKVFNPGDHIIKQGEHGDMFFIIAFGRVAVRKKSASLESMEHISTGNLVPQRSSFAGEDSSDDESGGDSLLGPVVAELTKGFFFGERALLLDEPRAATCVAVTRVVCYTLNRHAFKAVLSDVGQLLGSYARKHYTESPEFLTLSSHISYFGHRMHDAWYDNVSVDEPVEYADDVDPIRKTIDSMSLFSPEHTLSESIERICLALAELVNVRCARVFLYDRERQTFMVTSPSLLNVGSLDALESTIDPDSLDLSRSSTTTMSELCYSFRSRLFQHQYVRVSKSGIVSGHFSEEGSGVLKEAIERREPMIIDNLVEDERFDVDSEWSHCQREIDGLYSELYKITKQHGIDAMHVDSKAISNPGRAGALMDFHFPFKRSAGAVKRCQMMLVPVVLHGQPVAVVQVVGRKGSSSHKKGRGMSTAVLGMSTSVIQPNCVVEDLSEFQADFSVSDKRTAMSIANLIGEAFQNWRHEMDFLSDHYSFTPLFAITTPFSVTVKSAEKLTVPKQILQRIKSNRKKTIENLSARVVGHIFHGEYELCSSEVTSTVHFNVPHGEEDVSVRPRPIAQTDEEKKRKTSSVAAENEVETNLQVSWNEELSMKIAMCDLPPASRVVFEVQLSDGTTIGWTGCNLFTYQRRLHMGQSTLKLWPGEPTNAQIATTASPSNEYADDDRVGKLDVQLRSFDEEVWKTDGALAAVRAIDKIPLGQLPIRRQEKDMLKYRKGIIDNTASAQEFSEHKETLLRLFDREPLYTMTKQEKSMVWRCRHFLVHYSAALPKFLLSVPWDIDVAVEEAYSLMSQWTVLDSRDALQLLDMKFPDPKVRAFAVGCLEQLDNSTLHQYMLQLTQVLKFEPYLDSALVRFLLRRALRHPRVIGHVLFWYLKAEMHIPEIAARFGVVLDQYLRNCGEHKTDLGHQMFVMTKLQHIADEVKASASKEERQQLMRRRVKEIVFPERFQLPISPHLVVNSIQTEQCLVMSSKKLPLWLTFVSASEDQSLIKVLFKAGDDLRQDQLTLQILGIMDRLWKEQGLNLDMNAYRCISTGDELGMLEIVENAETLANIVKAEMSTDATKKKPGFKQKVRAAMHAMWKSSVFKDWLMKQEGNKNRNDEVVDRFMRSCAGYCVATYVLGIGDRHNDNIMLTKNGQLFHIDFGHFLGNFKSKMGYKREKAPFVFTPAFAEVLGGVGSAKFAEFEDLCGRAYNVLRDNGNILITLFFLMLSCGLPELREESDINWLRDKLMLDATAEEADAAFRQLIRESMNTKTTLLNHAVHSFAHG